MFFLTSQAWAATVCNNEMTPAVQADYSVMSIDSDEALSDCNDSSNGDMSDLCASACMAGCLNISVDTISSVLGDDIAYSLKSDFPINDILLSGHFVSDPPPPRL